ncbi:unnamed protein product [Mytilus coruscus]|uniref:NCAN n=1 Tax=Mytilus coruscus TaxID=42192 RepID=A0A6J8CCY0_MYTCO|nr:unnamed protein product [Mytilus coruscus]
METFREDDELFKEDQETKGNKTSKIWKFLNSKDMQISRNRWRIGTLFIITTVLCVLLIIYYRTSSSKKIAKTQEDACVSSPFLNGGTCITAGCSYYCRCPESYSGYQCEGHSILASTDLPGNTHAQIATIVHNAPEDNLLIGSCSRIDIAAVYQSSPIILTSMTSFSTEKTPCSLDPCLHNGTCTVVKSSFKCACVDGYNGSKCEETPCSLDPCVHNGTCTVLGNSFNCACVDGYNGTKCEVQTSCPLGWTMHEHNCYYFSSRENNWNDAKRACKRQNSMLAEATSLSKIRFLKTNAKQYLKEKDTAFWLGGSDLAYEGVWVWTTSGRKVSFTDWHTRTIHEPNNWNGKEHCLELNNFLDYEWNDDNCLKRNKYICEKQYV